MAGLDNIKRYEEGSSVTSNEQTPPLSAKAPKSTGPYALPTPTSVTGVDPELLQNMQQLIADRERQKNSLNEAMRDATAWWSGGVAGPGEALARRAKEREEEAATTFGMKRDLASYKVAQQQALNQQRQLFGTTPPPAAAATAGKTETGQQMAGTAPSAAVPPAGPQGGLLGLVRDDALRTSIAAQAMRDQNGAFTAIQSYLAKNAEDPQLAKDVNWMIKNGLIDPKILPAAVLTKFVGSGALVPHDVRGVQGTGQSTPLGSAVSMSPTLPGAGAPKLPAAVAPSGGAAAPSAPAAAPAAAPANPPVAPAAEAPAAAPKQALPHTQPIQKVEPVAAKPVTVAPPVAKAPEAAPPLVAPNLQTGFAPGSKEDLEAKAAAAKSTIESNAEQQKPIQKSAGESAVALTNAAATAPKNIREFDMAESILRQYPKAFGISQDGSVTAMLSQLIGPGVTVPIVGTLKAPGLEEARAQKLGPKALAARAAFDTIATRVGVEFAKQNLTGEGRGTLSNSDMKMAGVAKGLSTSSPAAANLIFTILNRENEQKNLERGNAWIEYQAQARKNGTTADFNRFRETDAYKKAEADEEARVRRRFPEFFANEKGTETGSTKKTAKDFFNK